MTGRVLAPGRPLGSLREGFGRFLGGLLFFWLFWARNLESLNPPRGSQAPEIRSQRRPWTPRIHHSTTRFRVLKGNFTGRFFMGATVTLAVGRQQGSVLDRPAPSMSRGLSAAHHRRWAAYAMSLRFRGTRLLKERSFCIDPPE